MYFYVFMKMIIRSKEESSNTIFSAINIMRYVDIVAILAKILQRGFEDNSPISMLFAAP